MALQTSGPISLGDVQGEFGGTAPTAISEYYGADDGVPTSGEISLSDFYGASSTNIVIIYSSQTWTVPTGVTYITLCLWGGGGGGAYGYRTHGGGGYAGWYTTSGKTVSGGQQYPIVIGWGGQNFVVDSSNTASIAGNAGTATTGFSLTANPGNGGTYGSSAGYAGNGSSATARCTMPLPYDGQLDGYYSATYGWLYGYGGDAGAESGSAGSADESDALVASGGRGAGGGGLSLENPNWGNVGAGGNGLVIIQWED